MICLKCGSELTGDEIGLYRKLINRAAKEYMCVPCMAEYFGVTEKLIREKIEYFKKSGCTLFND